MTEVMHFRLINGEEIIGDVVLYDDRHLTIREPMTVTEQMSPDGREVMALVPYMIYSDQEDLLLPRDKVVSMVDVHPIIEDHYRLSLHFADKAMDHQFIKIAEVNQYMRDSIALEGSDEDENIVSTSWH